MKINFEIKCDYKECTKYNVLKNKNNIQIKFIGCEKCRETFYCSEECKKEDWYKYKKFL